MATALTHAFVAVAFTEAAYPRTIKMPWKLRLLAIACSVGPDVDIGLFHYGVRYEDLWGHRGIMHSLFFAVVVSMAVTSWLFRKEAGWLSRKWWRLCAFFFAVTASHGFLDAFTNGGLGIAFFTPFDTTRYFMPWRPLLVSHFGLTSMLTEHGMRVVLSEVLWVWLPVSVAVALSMVWRRALTARRSATGG